MAQSFKISPFTSLGTNNQVISDDYIHGTFETYKFKYATANGSKGDYKVKVSTSLKDGKIAAKISDEAKFQFPVLDKYTVQFGERRNGDLRIHLDLGNYNIHGKSINFFTNTKTDVTLQKFKFRFGTNYFGTSCESSTRLELTPGDAPVATHRAYVKKGSLFYGAVLSLNLQSLALSRYDALLGYNSSKYELNLKHESTDATKVAVGTLTATATLLHDDKTKAAIEIKNKGAALKPAFTLGAQRKVNSDLTVKGKIDSDLKLALATKYALNKQFTLTAALELALSNGKCCNLNNFPPIPFGLQLETNI